MATGVDQSLVGKEEDSASWKKSLKLYRQQLLLWGVEGGAWVNGKTIRKGMDRAEAAAELKRTDGELSEFTLLRTRVRYFSDGVAIGGREFVEVVFEACRDRFGPRRKEGTRKLRGTPQGFRLFALRDVRGR